MVKRRRSPIPADFNVSARSADAPPGVRPGRSWSARCVLQALVRRPELGEGQEEKRRGVAMAASLKLEDARNHEHELYDHGGRDLWALAQALWPWWP
ncbi:hypothetical protein NL676_007345 [Syzygium grande]|nr:hypothetical protein NL676_007345 [Syzygium grande]